MTLEESDRAGSDSVGFSMGELDWKADIKVDVGFSE